MRGALGIDLPFVRFPNVLPAGTNSFELL
jgi:hypothetical protein